MSSMYFATASVVSAVPDTVLMGHAKAFVLPMNLLVVAMLAAVFFSLASVFSQGNRRDVRDYCQLTSISWLVSLAYLLTEALPNVFLQSHASDLSQWAASPAVRLAVSAISSYFLFLAACPFLPRSHAAKIAAHASVPILAGTFVMAVVQDSWLLPWAVTAVAYSTASLLLNAHAVSRFARTLLHGQRTLALPLAVAPIYAYAALQTLYLPLLFPIETRAFTLVSTEDRVLAATLVSSMIAVVGFTAGFIMKATHLVGILMAGSTQLAEAQILGRQRDFLTEAIHELKTPTTELRLSLKDLQTAVLDKSNVRSYRMATESLLARIVSIIEGTYLLSADRDVRGGALDREWPNRTEAEDPWRTTKLSAVVQAAAISVKATRKRSKDQPHIVYRTKYSSLEIVCRRYALIQVFANLIHNAFDVLWEGGGTITLTVRREQASDGMPPGECAVVEVADDGPGVERTVRRRLFERGVSTKRGEIKGIGLHVASRIVAMHGGTIVLLDSGTQPGSRGAIFRVCLPTNLDKLK